MTCDRVVKTKSFAFLAISIPHAGFAVTEPNVKVGAACANTVHGCSSRHPSTGTTSASPMASTPTPVAYTIRPCSCACTTIRLARRLVYAANVRHGFRSARLDVDERSPLGSSTRTNVIVVAIMALWACIRPTSSSIPTPLQSWHPPACCSRRHAPTPPRLLSDNCRLPRL